MPTLHPISGCDDDGRLLDVIFVHGFGAHYLNSWRYSEKPKGKSLLGIFSIGKPDHVLGTDKESNHNFMLSWLGKDLNRIGVWALEHESKQKSWERSLILEDVVPGIRNEIELVRKLGNRPLAMIGHSYGGLIIKKLLYDSRANDSNIHRQCKYVCFLATPHLGSGWANFLTRIAAPMLSRTASDLAKNNPCNSSLYEWYSNNFIKITTISFIENQDAKTIVDRDSGYAGVGKRIITTSDHNEIAKPRSRSGDPYKTIQASLSALLEELRPVSEQRLAAHRIQANQAGAAPVSSIQKHDDHLIIAVVPSLHQLALEKGGEKYMLRHWLFHGDEKMTLDNSSEERKNRLDACASGGVPGKQLKEYFAELIRYAANDLISSGGRLFVRILLPADLLSDDSSRNLPTDDFPWPVFWGCSSRYRVGGSDLDKTWLKSRTAFDKKCQIFENKLASAGSNLGNLVWGSLSLEQKADHASLQACCPSLESLDPSDLDDPGPINPLGNKEAILLSSTAILLQASSPTDHQAVSASKRWSRIILSGVPLAFLCPADPSGNGPTDWQEHRDCIEILMRWSKETWMEKMNRYFADDLSESERPELPMWNFLRRFHFIYEDLHYAPDRVNSPLGVSSSTPPSN